VTIRRCHVQTLSGGGWPRATCVVSLFGDLAEVSAFGILAVLSGIDIRRNCNEILFNKINDSLV